MRAPSHQAIAQLEYNKQTSILFKSLSLSLSHSFLAKLTSFNHVFEKREKNKCISYSTNQYKQQPTSLM
jgi:hypothetical protein